MHYYIDGYNMMFRILRGTEGFQVQREQIIRDLNTKVRVVGLDATLVFDAKYQKGELTRFHISSLEILFTNEGETADEFILNELKSTLRPQENTVVTSDKKLSYLARLAHSHTETIEQFLLWLNRRYKNKLKGCPKKKKLNPELNIKTKERAPNIPPEACFDDYLRIFEERVQKQSVEPKLKQKEIITEMERWLRLFEKDRE